jgi:CheY-like chemotaxis protein
MKILVVDDVGYTRHYHARLLQKFGHEVLSAEGGPQALRLLERDLTIDVVLTDLLMRDMDGVELFKGSLRINRMVDGGQANPPVFILMTAMRPSANGQQKDIEKIRMAKEIGFAEVLFKPIDPEQLKTILETVRFARGKEVIDISGALRRVTELVDRLLNADDTQLMTDFVEGVRTQLDRLDAKLIDQLSRA